MSLKNFFCFSKTKKNESLVSQRIYSALVDSSTNIVLSIDTNVSTIEILSEWTGSDHIATVNYPHYYTQPFFLASVPSSHYPYWTWERTKRTFLRTRDDVLNDSIKSQAFLINRKRDVMNKILVNLNAARNKIRTGVDFQETVYMTKKMQAQTFKDSGFDEVGFAEFSYVVQYADYAKISLRQAAEDILLKAKFDEEILLKTELLRLKYLKKVREATDAKVLPGIYEEFIRDCYVNAKV